MANKDSQLMKEITSPRTLKLFLDDAKKCFLEEDHNFFETDFAFPLAKNVRDVIEEVIAAIGDSDSDYEIFKCQKTLNQLWQLLIGESIKCLRFFDTREPYIYKEEESSTKFRVRRDKRPNAYGLDALAKYFSDYTEFERMLYGSSKYYRDHVIHVFRTWLTGVDCLIKNKGMYIKTVFIYGKDGDVELNFCEKLSIWTIVALTHDLGYPLEKAKDILDTTRNMVSTFIANPSISMDLAFQGVQNYMNDFVVKMMSSKVEKRQPDQSVKAHDGEEDIKPPEGLYYARIQPKYYYKFQKSLERTEHGIISTLIIYKLLTYFLESEYSINEDYPFNGEERRQFYIRREILRSIASHTCKDVYHMYMGSFPFLLIVADDTQEWGRKYISELYVESGKQYKLDKIEFHVKTKQDKCNSCSISEEITLTDKHDKNAIQMLIKRLRLQAVDYVILFRDGQDTTKRDFKFEKKCRIIYERSSKITFDLTLIIDNTKKASFECDIDYPFDNEINKDFDADFFLSIFDQDDHVDVKWSAINRNGCDVKTERPVDQEPGRTVSDDNMPMNWNTGKVTFSLLN